jgi:hypothetical protein
MIYMLSQEPLKRIQNIKVKATEACVLRGCSAQYGGREASREVGTRVYMEEAFRHLYD